MTKIKLLICKTRSGKEPFTDWFNKLDRASRFKISAALFQMEEGNFSDSKFVGKGVWERRIHAGGGFRIYFAKSGRDFIVLLGGSNKGGQGLQIRRAHALWKNQKSNY